MNLLIRRCFEPDSIAFMKPAAVVAGVFDFEGKEDECEDEDEGGEDDVDDVEDINGLITNLSRHCFKAVKTFLRDCYLESVYMPI